MDEISVKNLEVFCHHGVYKEENVLGQKFLVDIISKVDTREAGKTDELDMSVSYGDICRCVKKEMTKRLFVLEPLCMLYPRGIHPLERRRYADILEDLKGKEQ